MERSNIFERFAGLSSTKLCPDCLNRLKSEVYLMRVRNGRKPVTREQAGDLKVMAQQLIMEHSHIRANFAERLSRL